MIQEVACLWHPSFHGLRRSVWRRPCFLVLARLPYQVMSFNGNSWEASDGWQVPGFNGRTKWPKNKVCPLGFPKITILIECHEKNKCLYIHIYIYIAFKHSTKCLAASNSPTIRSFYISLGPFFPGDVAGSFAHMVFLFNRNLFANFAETCFSQFFGLHPYKSL